MMRKPLPALLLIAFCVLGANGIPCSSAVPDRGAPDADSTVAGTTNTYLIDLPTALELAGAQNLDVQIARQKLIEARANYESATWQFFPWISPGVSYRRHDNLIQNVEGKILEAHKESYAVGPSVMGQLEIGDAIFKRVAARQLVKASDYALKAQRQDVIVAAAQGYFDLLKAKAAVDVAADAVAISTNYAGQVEQAIAAGIAFKGDLLRVRVQAEKNTLVLRQAQEQQRVAAARLAQTLHLDPLLELVPRETDIVPLSLFDTNATLDSLVGRAIGSRPELKQSRALVEGARNARQGAVYGPLIPALGAQTFIGGLGGGQDGSPSTFGESEDYQVTLGWRIGPGGLFDQGRLHATDARLQIARLGEKKLLDDVTRQKRNCSMT
jgi:outer membrane protein TolC